MIPRRSLIGYVYKVLVVFPVELGILYYSLMQQFRRITIQLLNLSTTARTRFYDTLHAYNIFTYR